MPYIPSHKEELDALGNFIGAKIIVSGNSSMVSELGYGWKSEIEHLQQKITTVSGQTVTDGVISDTSSGPATRLILVTYNSDNAFGSSFRGQRARGAVNSPSGVLNDDVLLQLVGDGHNGSGFINATASFVIKAEEDWTTGTHATYILMRTTPSGGNSQLERFRIDSNGKVGISNENPQYRLDVSGNSNFTEGVYWNGVAVATGDVVRPSDINLIPVNFNILKSGESITGLSYANGKTLQIFRSGDLITGTFDGVYRKTVLYDGDYNITGVLYNSED